MLLEWRLKVTMNRMLLSVFLTLWIFCFDSVAPAETCHFPDFLQSTPTEGTLKPWTTRMWWLYLRHAPKWAEKQDIYVKHGHMWRHREHNLQSCERSPRRVYHKTSFGHCSERQLVYNRTCISEEGYNTFRVIQYSADRTHRFTCMKFVRKSNNVVQVYEGPLSDTNDLDLCESEGLRLDEWPWTAPWENEPSFCPVSGGYSFRTIRRLTNESRRVLIRKRVAPQDFCEDEWRRSYLEVECIKGDGMDFIAPKNSNCNPFLKEGDWKRLTCWAGWEHGDFIFMIASDVGRQPRYCLRFPRIQEGEFSVLVYFSVICPMENDGKPPHGIEYYELRMFRKDPDACRDESVQKCREIITSPEMCIKDKVFAPHCPQTCGKCTESTVSEINGRRCWLNPTLYGNWRLYDKSITADVDIDKEKAVFSHLGAYQCLEKDKNEQRYKMASLFNNGCSPRYTCMEFNRRNNNILQYRISPSERSELTMEELCNFKNDAYPLEDLFRSYYFKNLILARDLWPSYCGINSVIPFNGTINGRQCTGTVSDWDQETCTTRGTLALRSNTCKELLLPMEFQCLAFIHDEAIPLQQLLLTRSLDGRNEFNCWILTSYVGGGQWPWRVLYQMPTAQCSLVMEVDMSSVRDSDAALYLDDRSRSKFCKPDEETKKTQNDVTKSTATNVSYIIPNQGDGASKDTQVNVKTGQSKQKPTPKPPITDFHSTDPPIWGVRNTGGNFIGQEMGLGKKVFVILFVLSYCILQRTLIR